MVWAYATTNSPDNTIHKVSLGLTWAAVGMAEARPAGPHSLSVRPTLVRAGCAVSFGSDVTGTLALWDATGRLVRSGSRTGDLSTRGLAPGVYVLTLDGPAANLSRRLVITK